MIIEYSEGARKQLKKLDNSVKTLRSDLEGLVAFGLMMSVALNKRLTGYAKSRDFESKLEEIKGN